MAARRAAAPHAARRRRADTRGRTTVQPDGRRPRRNPDWRRLMHAAGAPVRAHRRVGDWATGRTVVYGRPAPAPPPPLPPPPPSARRRAPAGRATVTPAERERREARQQEAREQRAAVRLAIDAERLREAAWRARAAEERAATAATRRTAGARATKAETRAAEYADLLGRYEAGQLGPTELAYFINAHGTNRKK